MGDRTAGTLSCTPPALPASAQGEMHREGKGKRLEKYGFWGHPAAVVPQDLIPQGDLIARRHPGRQHLFGECWQGCLKTHLKPPGLKQHRSCATLLLPQEVFARLCLRGCCRKQQWEKGNFCEWFGAELAEMLGDISSSQGAQLGLSVSPLQVWVLQLCVPPPGV